MHTLREDGYKTYLESAAHAPGKGWGARRQAPPQMHDSFCASGSHHAMLQGLGRKASGPFCTFERLASFVIRFISPRNSESAALAQEGQSSALYRPLEILFGRRGPCGDCPCGHMAKGLGSFGSQPQASRGLPHADRGKIDLPRDVTLLRESLKHIFLIPEVLTIYSCS
jgi:hypothetical protein